MNGPAGLSWCWSWSSSSYTGPALFDLASPKCLFSAQFKFCAVAVHKSAKCKVPGILRQLP